MTTTKGNLTKKALIRTARAIVLMHGIEALTMDRLALTAGMSKGACMHHFKSKRALLSALIEDYVEHLDNELRRHEALFEGDPADTLVPAFAAWHTTFCADHRGWARLGLVLHAYCVQDGELLSPIVTWYEKLHRRIAAMPAESRVQALAAVMATEGFFYSRKLGIDLADPELKREVIDKLAAPFACRVRRKSASAPEPAEAAVATCEAALPEGAIAS